jgi:hypothetical protein
LRIERMLDAGQSFAVDAGVADHARGKHGARIRTAMLFRK